MAKGSYQIAGTPNTKRPPDTSWKSCMCTMIIILVIMLIVFLVIPWNPRETKKYKAIDSPSKEKLTEDTTSDTETFDDDHISKHHKYGKIISEPTTVTTPITPIEEVITKLYHHDIHEVVTESITTPATPEEKTITETYHHVETVTESITPEDKHTTESHHDELYITESSEIPSTTPKYVYHFEIDETKSESSDISSTTPRDEEYESSTFPSTNSEIISSTNPTFETSETIYIKDDDTTTEEHLVYDTYSTTDDSVLTSTIDSVLTSTISSSSESIIESKSTPTTAASITTIPSTVSFTATTEIDLNRTCSQICEKCLEKTENNDTCNTSKCKRSASKMLSLISHSNEACDNLYQYACEGISENYIAETDLNKDIWKRITRKLNDINTDSVKYLQIFKQYYTSCVNYDSENGINEMKLELKLVGKIYDTHTDLGDLPSLTNLLIKLLKKNFAALFDLRIGLNDKSKNFGIIITPVIYDSIHEIIFQSNRDKCNSIHDEYKTKDVVDLAEVNEAYQTCLNNALSSKAYIETIEKAMEHMNPFGTVFTPTIVREILTSMNESFLKTLEMNKPNATEIKDILDLKSENKIIITVEELHRQIKGINWDEIISQLGFEGCANSTEITVYHFDYLKQILNTMSSTHCKTNHNIILAIYLHHIYKDLILDQNRIVNRNDYCLKYSVNLMPDIASALYINSFNETEFLFYNNRYNEMFHKLVRTLKDEINTGGWLTDGKSLKAIEKLKRLVLYTMEPNILKIDDILDKQYKHINLNEIKNEFVLNTKKLETVLREAMYSKYQADPKLPENMWSMISRPDGIKPITLHNLDALVLPFALVHSQKQYDELPGYLTMSDLMFKLSRELNLYLMESNFNISEAENSHESMDIVIAATEETPEIKITLDPAQSLKERILDAAAAKLANIHYKRTYDRDSVENERPLPWLDSNVDQLYFVNLAQQFCTKKSVFESYDTIFQGIELHPIMKVNSIAVNSAQFRDVYNCLSNVTMTGGIKLNNPVYGEYESDE